MRPLPLTLAEIEELAEDGMASLAVLMPDGLTYCDDDLYRCECGEPSVEPFDDPDGLCPDCAVEANAAAAELRELKAWYQAVAL